MTIDKSQPAANTIHWIKCPICREPDMRCEYKNGVRYIDCTNESCPSNYEERLKEAAGTEALTDMPDFHTHFDLHGKWCQRNYETIREALRLRTAVLKLPSDIQITGTTFLTDKQVEAVTALMAFVRMKHYG